MTQQPVGKLSANVPTKPHPGLAVDVCLLLQQKLDHLDVAVVTGHM